MTTIVCLHCGRIVLRNKKLKHHEQRYCNLAGCQRARRLLFARKKYEKDKKFRSAKLVKAMAYRKKDRLKYSEYMFTYRDSHPEYVLKNNQKQRDRYGQKKGKKSGEEKIVNPYTLMPQQSDIEHVYAMFEIDQKMIVNPYTIMLEHIDKLSFTNAKPILVRLL